MRYYRATKEAYDHFTGWTLIAGELVTPHERNTRFRYLSDLCFEEVEVSRKRTYRMFGVRWESKTQKIDSPYSVTMWQGGQVTRYVGGAL